MACKTLLTNRTVKIFCLRISLKEGAGYLVFAPLYPHPILLHSALCHGKLTYKNLTLRLLVGFGQNVILAEDQSSQRRVKRGIFPPGLIQAELAVILSSTDSHSCHEQPSNIGNCFSHCPFRPRSSIAIHIAVLHYFFDHFSFAFL